MFFKGSRYAKVTTLELTDETGRTLQYKATRFIPDTPARLGHKVQGGERLDLFVPGRSLGGDAHWQLRRALLAFRPEVGAAEPDPSNGRSGV